MCCSCSERRSLRVHRCRLRSSDSTSSDSGATIIRGTTDQPISYDPAGAYDLPSYDGIYSMYQNLLTVEPGGSKAVPDAAKSCEFTDQDNTIFECTLNSGLKFSDGSDLTAEDVVFSFERNVDIADPNGASSLLANMKSIKAKGDDTVVFTLKEPDATWPLLLTTGSFAIVPSDVYPADKLQPSDEVVGSGRYTLADYQPGQQTVMEKNDGYQGADPAKNDRVIIQFFDKASALKLAVQNGDVDIAYRSLSPTDIADLEGADGVNVVSGNGTEIRYLVYNLDLQPGDNDKQKQAIRQADRAGDRPPGDRRQRLQRHRPAALFDGSAGRRLRDQGVLRRVRRDPGRRGRQADARRRRRRHAGAARGLVDPRRTTAPHPATSTRRSSASSTRAASST